MEHRGVLMATVWMGKAVSADVPETGSNDISSPNPMQVAPARSKLPFTGQLELDDEAWMPSEKADHQKLSEKRHKKVLVELYDDPDIEKISSDGVLQAIREVRERAGAWRIGVASVFTLVLATLVIEKPGLVIISGYPDMCQRILVIVLVVGAAVCGLLSLLFLLRAAHGPTKLRTKIKDLARPITVERALRQLRSTVRDFKLGQVLLCIAVIVFCAALVWTWIDPASGLK